MVPQKYSLSADGKRMVYTVYNGSTGRVNGR